MPTAVPDSSMRKPLRDAALFHLAFFAVAIPSALLAKPAALGPVVLGLSLLYNLALPLTGHLRGHANWLRLWAFLLPLSAALPCADWMLVLRMGTLEFPDHGVLRLGGAVPIYFMGLWIMLLWPLCWLAEGKASPWLSTALLAFTAFVAWEWAARPLQLWHAVGVRQWQGFALYPLLPEVLLSLAALWMWRQQGLAPYPQRLLAALSVAVFYAGALALALLWIG